MPALVLHALLLPVNACRLAQLFCAQLLHGLENLGNLFRPQPSRAAAQLPIRATK